MEMIRGIKSLVKITQKPTVLHVPGCRMHQDTKIAFYVCI